jgi:class 3 adenylate cyclase
VAGASLGLALDGILARVTPGPVSYAFNGDIALAYQVVGDGPVDVVMLPGLFSHLDVQWEDPRFAEFLQGLAEGHRLIVTDRRGLGLSERFAPDHVPPIESLVDDVLAVLDAANSDTAVVIGFWESGFVAQLLAAAHPNRVLGLVLVDSFATAVYTAETPWLDRAEQWLRNEARDSDWGRRLGSDFDYLLDQREREWVLRMQRASCTPTARLFEARRWRLTDTRGVLASIRVPTLVLHDADGADMSDPRGARLLAARIKDSQLVGYHGGDEFWWHRPSGTITTEVSRFVRGLGSSDPSFDRVLATVLFTDIVDSTTHAASIGDSAWRKLRERHDQIVRTEIARFRGQEIKTMGDGFLVTFDGPARGVRCAQEIISQMAGLGLQIRAGLHTGEIELDGDDITGIGVAISARVGALAGPSEVLVSQTIRDLTVGANLVLTDRGEHHLKGIPGAWRLYAVAG